ncbi:IPT/TIG domain-containing protein [Streptomyces sp. NPDC059564]|uniref:IPT/TIG domain-containing protein n=1 Tax=Streptomyces sp. NPDC059564 TaxID=3346865 RepID=UPI0036B876AE
MRCMLLRAATVLFAVATLAVAPALLPSGASASAAPIADPAADHTTCPGPATCPPAPGFADPAGEVVFLTPDTGPRSGGFTVTLTGTGLTPYNRVLFGVLDDRGCFIGLPATDTVVISDTTVVATAPAWPSAAQVTVVAATPSGRLTNPLTFTYVD